MRTRAHSHAAPERLTLGAGLGCERLEMLMWTFVMSFLGVTRKEILKTAEAARWLSPAGQDGPETDSELNGRRFVRPDRTEKGDRRCDKGANEAQLRGRPLVSEETCTHAGHSKSTDSSSRLECHVSCLSAYIPAESFCAESHRLATHAAVLVGAFIWSSI